MDAGNALGAFLRARRGLIFPDDVGLPSGGHRRVPGLRREELASLVGLSRDYYTRLEQGRERHPSSQVLAAIARALRLGQEETAHLFGLAQPASAVVEAVDEIHPPVRWLLDRFGDVPACIAGPAMDIVAMNPLAAAFYAGFASRDNLAKMVLLDPAARDFFRDWESIVHGTVGTLHASASRYPGNGRIADLLVELSARSTVFADLWSRQQIRTRASEDKRYRHPLVGDIELHFEACTINSSPGQQLFVYFPEPGSASEDALARLARRTTTPAVREPGV